MTRYLIGLDPGVNTGLAIYDPESNALVDVRSVPVWEALTTIDITYRIVGHIARVYFEDARLRTWFGSKGREALQGAGSIKRDCQIIEGFLSLWGVPFTPVKPQAGATKWSAEHFARVTGWQGRTNSHGRDAACLVWGRKG